MAAPFRLDAELAATPAPHFGPPTLAHDAPGFRAERVGADRCQLQLWGALPADWSLWLAQALAARRMSLMHGAARRGPRDTWRASLEIQLARSEDAELDFAALATGVSPAASVPDPPILHFQLWESRCRAPGLELEVHAWEALGLLAAVLGKVADADLRCDALLLDTEDDCAFHHLLLRTTDGRAPSARQQRALHAGLCELRGFA